MKKPMVSVVMITYKHEAFIREAIEGVLMQECDFDVELIIADDGSPDDTSSIVQNIISTHPKGHWIKYTRHQENKGMMPNFIWSLQQCKGKYIALCEGDDYWIDPLKLQKQVDFLEENKEYSMCFTNRKMLINNNFIDQLSEESEYITQDIYSGFIPSTQTIVFRTNSLNANLLSTYNSPSGDRLLCFILSLDGKIKKLNFTSAIYRYTEDGIWSSFDYETQQYKSLQRLFDFKNNIADPILSDSKIIISRKKFYFSVLKR
ncbi:MAG TPA: glycosyltransferase, partial [Saprospiraceae bacterium]|nr:glycosyltransferase [Saprospiraceae bacterium]